MVIRETWWLQYKYSSVSPVVYIVFTLHEILYISRVLVMSLVRVSLIAAQAISNHLAYTPPNPTPSKGRYHTEELYVLQIAPLIFKVST
jgi:hypothetical protein